KVGSVRKLPYGGPLGLNYTERQQTHDVLREFIDQNRSFLQLAPTEEYQIPSIHPLVRVNRPGSIRWDLAVEIVQKVRPDQGAPFSMGVGKTLIIQTHSTASGAVDPKMFPRFVIAKPFNQTRAEAQQAHLTELGYIPDGDPARYRINFALLHGGD